MKLSYCYNLLRSLAYKRHLSLIYLFGISNCDRVVKARTILQSTQLDFKYIDFRKGNFSKHHIEQWLKKVSIDNIVSKRSKAWKDLTEQQQKSLFTDLDLQLLIDKPTLIKRPVLVIDKEITFGFDQKIYDTIK